MQSFWRQIPNSVDAFELTDTTFPGASLHAIQRLHAELQQEIMFIYCLMQLAPIICPKVHNTPCVRNTGIRGNGPRSSEHPLRPLPIFIRAAFGLPMQNCRGTR